MYRSCVGKQRDPPTEALYNDLYPALCKVVRMKPAIIIVETLPITTHHKRVFCHQNAFIALCFGPN